MTELIKKYSPLPLDEEKAGKMAKIYELLEEKNKVMNLTSIKAPEEAAELHFADSLYPLTTPYVKGRVLDVGSGGGFPAFPVAVYSGLDVTALDATAKKLDFIAETAKAVGLDNISTLCGRAEELSHDKKYRDSFDTVLSRGVARLNVLCEWCMPYVKPNGFFIALKGSNGEEEARDAENAVKTLGGKIVDMIRYDLPLSGHTHTLIVIAKESRTPDAYPRHNSQITKKPL